MKEAANFPRLLFDFISARKISPVEICSNPNFSMIFSLCVPFPDPGGPKITTLNIVVYLVFIIYTGI
jgi:hypothetical protein